MTVKTQQYSSNYEKRKLGSYIKDRGKKVKQENLLTDNFPFNVEVSISTLTDPSHNSIPATICLEREKTLSFILFGIQISFFQISLLFRLSGEVKYNM